MIHRATKTLFLLAVTGACALVSARARAETSIEPRVASQSRSIEGRQFSRKLDSEDVRDLSVKVLGGFVAVTRAWDGSKWTFLSRRFRRWCSRVLP